MYLKCVITKQILPSSGGLHVEFTTSWLNDVFLNILLLWCVLFCFFSLPQKTYKYDMLRILFSLCVCCWYRHLPVSLTAQVTEWLQTRSLKAPRVLPLGSWPFIPQKRSSKTSTDTLHIWSRRGLIEPAWLRLVYKIFVLLKLLWETCWLL